MPRLTEEQLSKLYPRAKTYDEIQTEREQLQEKRRPKFVAARVALWTSLCVPVVATVYYFGVRTLSGFTDGATMDALARVCFAILLAVAGIVSIYYLWYLADKVASKVILLTNILYLLLGGIVVAAVVVGLYAHHHTVGLFTSIVTAFTAVFILALWLTDFVLKKQ